MTTRFAAIFIYADGCSLRLDRLLGDPPPHEHPPHRFPNWRVGPATASSGPVPPLGESQTERGRRFCRRAAKFSRSIGAGTFGRARGPGGRVANAWVPSRGGTPGDLDRSGVGEGGTEKKRGPAVRPRLPRPPPGQPVRGPRTRQAGCAEGAIWVEQVRADGSRCNGPHGNSASGMRPDAIPKLRAGCSSHPGGTNSVAPRFETRSW